MTASVLDLVINAQNTAHLHLRMVVTLKIKYLSELKWSVVTE